MREIEKFGPNPEFLPELFFEKLTAILKNSNYEIKWIGLLSPSDSGEMRKLTAVKKTFPDKIFSYNIWGYGAKPIFCDDRYLISKNDELYVFDSWMDISGGYFPADPDYMDKEEMAGVDETPTEYLFNYQFYKINKELLKKIENLEAFEEEPDLHITYWEDNVPLFNEKTKSMSLSSDPETYTESSQIMIRVKEMLKEDELFKKILEALMS